MKPKEFISKYADAITRSTYGTNLFPSVAIAQAAMETGWGAHTIGNAHNLFGIKASPGWKGKVISATTFEYLNGVKTTFTGTGNVYNSYSAAISAGAHAQTLFRYYNSDEESFRDHAKLLTETTCYAPAMQCTTPESQMKKIIQCGYATASADGYTRSIMSIINTYDLTKYDTKKKIMKYVELAGAAVCVAFGLYFIYQRLK